MKLSIFMNVLLISSLSLLAVGCGKDKKKSKDNSYYGYYNPYTGGPVVNGQVAKDNLNAYVNAVEPKFIYNTIMIEKKRYSCTTKDFLGISFLPFDYCKSSDLGNVTGYSYQGQVRLSINSLLGTLLTPGAGYTLGNVFQQGPYIFVDHVSLNGVDTLQYAIDTTQHALVNPIQIKDTAQKRIDYVNRSNI